MIGKGNFVRRDLICIFNLHSVLQNTLCLSAIKSFFDNADLGSYNQYMQRMQTLWFK